MKNLDDVLQAIEERGAKFTINLQARTLKVDNKYVIGKGKSIEITEKLLDTDEFLKQLDGFYESYKYSVPSERSESRTKTYFRALREEELEDNDMFFGLRREPARFFLEAFVLIQIILGFQWDEEKMGKWFYQSKKDKDLVLLRQWFNNK